MLRPLYLVAGLAMLALGIIGAVVPLMPTTIFLIIAAWCFARSSPRLEAWLLAHPSFCPMLLAWRDQGAISPRNKILACTGMVGGLLVFWLGAHPTPWVALLVGVTMLASAGFVLTRPEPRQPKRP